MKIQTLLSVAALGAISLFSFCKNDAAAAKDAAADTQSAPAETAVTVAENPAAPPAAAPSAGPEVPLPPVTSTPAPTPPKEPAQNAKGVWHYTCPKGCAGGGGAAGPCAKCGTTLTHNAAYHGQPTPSATTTPTPGQTPPPAKTEPAQNAAGVWHYTCPDGCAGGGGSAVACTKCGKKLVHNSAYHQ